MSKAPKSSASGAEVIPDVDDAGHDAAPAGDPGEINEATGLTAEEQAEFERMQAGDDGAGDPPGDPPAEGDPDPNAPADPVDPADPADPADPEDGDPDPDDGEAARTNGKQPPKSVSYGKYQRETTAARKRAKAEAEARAKVEADNIRLAERIKIINEALSAAPPAAAVDPAAPEEPKNPFEEPDVDPTVDYAGAVAQVNRRNRFMYEQHQASVEAHNASDEDRNLLDTFTRDAQVYAQQEPEFPEAYAFLKDSRLIEIAISEFDKDPRDPNAVFSQQEIDRMVAVFNAEEKWVVNNAISARKSPAAAIMKLARARGFTKAAPAAAATAPPAAKTNGAAAAAPAARRGTAAAPPATAGRNVAAEIADLAKARDDGRSLSDGGAAPADALTMESLLRMSDDEFADYVETLPPAKLDAIMGR